MGNTVEPNVMATMANIFKEFSHPFALVGIAAHRWMGCSGGIDAAIDLLLRDDQLELISAAFVESGHWKLLVNNLGKRNCKVGHSSLELEHHDYNKLKNLQECKNPEDPENPDMEICNYYYDADMALRLSTEADHSWRFFYVRLWSEQTFHLKVDEISWFKIPALFHGEALLAEEKFHPTADRTDGWIFGPRLLSQYEDRLITIGKAEDNTLLIPSIPSYLDALVYHATQYPKIKPSLAFASQWQIRNLTRYLYLELPERRYTVLFEVEANTERWLENYLNNYKRKPHYALSKGGELVLVECHRPESFPEPFLQPTSRR